VAGTERERDAKRAVREMEREVVRERKAERERDAKRAVRER
jgi:hypothetical protein